MRLRPQDDPHRCRRHRGRQPVGEGALYLVGRPGLDPGDLGIRRAIPIVQAIQLRPFGQLRLGPVSTKYGSGSLRPLV